jgi:hypothetical protein
MNCLHNLQKINKFEQREKVNLDCFGCLELRVILSTRNDIYIFFFLPCISIYACNSTNSIHYVSSVYSVTILLHVSSLLVAHHQEETMYLCNEWKVLYYLVLCKLASQLRVKTYNTYQFLHIYIVTS